MKSTENSRGTAKNTGRTAKNLMWIYSMEWRGLTGAGEMRRSPPLSGHDRLMQRSELVKTGRPAVAAAAVEPERQYSGERRKTMEATSNWSLMGWAIYKVRLISGREKRGGHGVVISP